MGQSLLAPVLLTLGVYLILQVPSKLFATGEESGVGARGAFPLLFKGPVGYGRLRGGRPAPSLDRILFDDSDSYSVSKRQFDDYGHMRFGKRGEAEEKFDDYGHMRFGRSPA